MSSLEYLIELSQKTGDRLIVHNPLENQDVVIMSVDDYERLVLGKKDVRSLSSGQLIDQINRDIAAWRANKEMDEEWEREMMLEDEFENEEPFDPFAEYDSHLPEWHSAGSVLGDRYNSNFSENSSAEFEDETETDEIPDFDLPLQGGVRENEEPVAVPYQEHENSGVWKEEPLSDGEPVFYEEPV